MVKETLYKTIFIIYGCWFVKSQRLFIVRRVQSYRYGFNGKENDNEVKGEGNQQDYGARIYDPRAGRFLSVDPMTKRFPELTPYQFASNKPINSIDLDGLESKEVYAYFDPMGKEVFHLEKSVNNPYKLGSGTLFHINVETIVNSEQINASTVEVTFRNHNLHAYVPKPKTIYQIAKEKMGSLLNSFSGSEESMQEFGFVMSGNAPSTKAGAFDFKSNAKNKEYLDLGLFLGVMGNLREFSGKQEIMDIGEDILGATQTLNYLKSKDNLLDAFQAIKDAGTAINEMIKTAEKITITIEKPDATTSTMRTSADKSTPDTIFVKPKEKKK